MARGDEQRITRVSACRARLWTKMRPRTSNKGAVRLCVGRVAAQARAAAAQGVSATGISNGRRLDEAALVDRFGSVEVG